MKAPNRLDWPTPCMLWRMRTLRIVALASALAASPVLAKDAKPAKEKPKVDLNLPSFGEIPKGEDLQKPKMEKGLESAPTPAQAAYAVTKVQHAKGFTRTTSGAAPAGGELTAIPLSGNPPTTEKFTTVVRIKSPQRANAPIDVVILDTRGDTAMSASGEVSFRGAKGDEAEWTVDWDPTPLRGPGQYQVLIRVAGQPLGTWPLAMGDAKK